VEGLWKQATEENGVAEWQHWSLQLVAPLGPDGLLSAREIANVDSADKAAVRADLFKRPVMTDAVEKGLEAVLIR